MAVFDKFKQWAEKVFDKTQANDEKVLDEVYQEQLDIETPDEELFKQNIHMGDTARPEFLKEEVASEEAAIYPNEGVEAKATESQQNNNPAELNEAKIPAFLESDKNSVSDDNSNLKQAFAENLDSSTISPRSDSFDATPINPVSNSGDSGRSFSASGSNSNSSANPPDDGSTSNSDISSVVDANTSENLINESASVGDVVGVTAFADDADSADSVTYSLGAGTLDNDAFSINPSTGEVTVANPSALDFETDPTMQIQVTATSSDGSSSVATFNIGVQDVNESPDGISLSNLSVSENASGEVVGTLTTSDVDSSDSHTYSVNDARFEVVDDGSGNMQLKLKDGESLDHETSDAVNVTVTSTDSGGLSTSQDFSINVLDVNEAPTNINFTAQSQPPQADFSAVDGYSGTSLSFQGLETGSNVFTLSFDTASDVISSQTLFETGGAGYGLNVVIDQGQLKVFAGGGNNLELSVPIDGDTTYSFALEVNNDNDSLTLLLSDTLPLEEMTVDNSMVASQENWTDVDWDGGNDLGVGLIGGGSSQGSVGGDFQGSIDEPGLKVFADSDLEAVFSYTGIDENSAGAVVGTVSTSDPDDGDSHSYTVSDSRFEIVDDGNGNMQLKLKDDESLDHESSDTVNVTITSTDSGGLFTSQDIEINVEDINEAPTDFSFVAVEGIDVANYGFEANQYSEGLYSLSATDWNVSNIAGTWNPHANAYNSDEEIEGNSVAFANNGGQLSQVTPENFEEGQSYSLSVDIGNRGDVIGDASGATIKIYAGTTLIAEHQGSNAGEGEWETVTLNFDASGFESGDSVFGQPLEIRLENNGSIQVGFDNVQLRHEVSSDTHVLESAANGTVVGLITDVIDADVGETFTYSLLDDSNGAFAINQNSGEVTVADGGAIDYEAGSSQNITVQVTDSGGNVYSEVVQINIGDDVDEFDISAVTDSDTNTNSVSESATVGTSVGVTAFADDADSADSVSYSLDNDFGGAFAIDANTGEVTVANPNLLDYETNPNPVITVRATSSDNSFSTADMTINLSDASEDVGSVTDSNASANSVSESAAIGSVVGVTAFAIEDSTDSVSYSLGAGTLDNDAFSINPSTGEVTVANPGALDFETDATMQIQVTATSSDGSSSVATFDISIGDDVDEYDISAVTDSDTNTNSVNESANVGDSVGVTAFADDADSADSVSYSLGAGTLDNDAFSINPSTGEVTVANPGALDFETDATMQIQVTATSSDGSSSNALFNINISDANDDPIITKVVASNTTTSLTQNDVVINAGGSTGTMGDNVNISVFQPGGSASQIVVTTGGIGIDSTNVTNDIAGQIDYDPVTGESEQLVLEFIDPVVNLQITTGFQYAAEGGVGEQGIWTAYDASGNIIGSGELDADLGVNVGSNSYQYDLETNIPISKVVIEANDYSDSDFSIVGVQFNEIYEVPLNTSETINVSISEGISNGISIADVNAFDVDGDTLTYSITAGNEDSAFIIDSVTGVITVADTNAIDYESASIRTLTVSVDDGNGGTDTATIEINISDDNSEFSITPVSDTNASANSVTESAAVGTAVGVTALASDADGSDSVTYSLDNDFGGAFAIDANTGEVTVANPNLLDYETNPNPVITVRATSSDNSFSTADMTINLSDASEDVGSVTDSNASANSVSESAAIGSVVGVTAFAIEDSADSVSYSLSVNPNNAFAINSSTGVVTVADPNGLDFETASTMQIQVTATSSDSSSSSAMIDIAIEDINEAPTSNDVDSAMWEDSTIVVSEATLITVFGATDPDGDTLSVTSFTSDDPGAATITDNGNGTWTISAAPNYNGNDVGLTAVISDGEFSTTAHASIDILAINDTPNDIDLSTTPNQSYSNAVNGSGDGPVIYLQLDDSSMLDGATAEDDSGNGHVAMYQGDMNSSQGPFGTAGNAAHLNSGEYIEVAPSNEFSLAEGTVQIWFNPDDLSGDQTLVSRDSSGFDNGGHFHLEISSSGSLQLRMQDTNSSLNLSSSTGLVTTDDWQHAAVSFGPDGAKLFLNGVEVGSDPSWTHGIQGNNEPWTLGAGQTVSGDSTANNLNEYFDGHLSEFSVHDHQMDVSDVNEFYGIFGSNDFGNHNIAENNAGAVVGSLSTLDPDVGDSHSYTVDDARFEVVDDGNGNQVLKLKDGESLDYESEQTVDVTVTSTDTGGLAYSEAFTINVSNIIEAPSNTEPTSPIDQSYSNAVNGSGDGPVIYLQLDDSSMLDGATAEDDSGNGHVAMYQGDMNSSQGPFGTAGNAAHLNSGEYIEVAPSNEFSLAEGTVQIWFNPDDLSGDQTLVSRDSSGFDNGGHFHLEISSSGSLQLRMQDTNSSLNLSSSTGLVTTDDWQHAAVSFGPDGAKLFLNGVEVGSDPSWTHGIQGNNEPWTLGAGQTVSGDSTANNLNEYFDGHLSEFSVHDHQMDVSEVNEFYDIASSNPILGTNDAETLNGSVNDDAILGHDGNDIINGGDGDDFLSGGNGDDILNGDSGDDRLYGGDGDDNLNGGDGNDVLIGGAGNDIAIGGAGDDVYIFEALGDSDTFSGGDGGGWTDVIELDVDVASQADPDSPWTITVDGNEVGYAVDQGFLDLGPDASGVISFDDGSEINFDGVEQIQW